MKFTTKREDILYPLNRVNTVIEVNPTIAILSHVLLEVYADNEIQLTGSNIEMEISDRFPAVIDGVLDQPIAFPVMEILKFVNQLPKDCELTAEIDENFIIIIGNGSKLKTQLKVMDEKSEFPIMDFDQDTLATFDIDRSNLRELLYSTRHAMGTDSFRYYLNALTIEVDASVLRGVATDGHRMAVNEISIEANLEAPVTALVPRQAIFSLCRLMSEFTTAITVRVSNNHIRMVSGTSDFACRLLEGQAVEWRKAVPEETSKALSVNRKAMIDVLKRMKILKTDDKRPIGADLEAIDGVLTINGKTTTGGGQEINETLNVEQGEFIGQFMLNNAYVLDALEAMPNADNVEFHLQSIKTACLIKDPTNTVSFFIVMTMKN